MYDGGESIAVLVPIFGILMIIAVVIGPVWVRNYYRSKEREQLHQTLRTAYEKGLAPPPELIEKLTAEVGPARPSAPVSVGSDRDLRRAVVLIAVGAGVAALGLGLGWGIGGAGGDITGGVITGAGAIPGFIGIAYLLLWILGRNRPTT